MMRGPDRRTVLLAAGALAGVATVAQSAGRPGAEPLTLFDPHEPDVGAFAASGGGATIPIEGDRVRLARRVLAGTSRPRHLTVIGRHADVLLLSDAAREAGYRSLAQYPFPAADGHAGLFVWTAQLAVRSQ